NVTGQSDLFSLGITLFQLLTGNPPFRADSIPRLMQKIAHERHPSVREARDDLPACIDGVLDRALAKDPSDRYPSGRAMALAVGDGCGSLDSTAPARSSGACEAEAAPRSSRMLAVCVSITKTPSVPTSIPGCWCSPMAWAAITRVRWPAALPSGRCWNS